MTAFSRPLMNVCRISWVEFDLRGIAILVNLKFVEQHVTRGNWWALLGLYFFRAQRSLWMTMIVVVTCSINSHQFKSEMLIESFKILDLTKCIYIQSRSGFFGTEAVVGWVWMSSVFPWSLASLFIETSSAWGADFSPKKTRLIRMGCVTAIEDSYRESVD